MEERNNANNTNNANMSSNSTPLNPAEAARAAMVLAGRNGSFQPEQPQRWSWSAAV